MKKLKMSRVVTLTFEEGCNRYLENCRQRNLREGTINHYRQSYLYFYKFFDHKMPIEDKATFEQLSIKKVGHIILEFSPVMCPMFLYRNMC